MEQENCSGCCTSQRAAPGTRLRCGGDRNLCGSAKELGGRVGGGWHSTACPLCMFRGWKRSSCSAGVRFPPSTPAAGGLGHVRLGEQQGLAWRRVGGGVVPGLQLPAGAAAAPGRSSQSAPALSPYKRRAAARPRPFPVMAAEDRGCGLGAIRRHPPAPGAFPPPCPAASVPRGLGYRAVAAGGARMVGGADAG